MLTPLLSLFSLSLHELQSSNEVDHVGGNGLTLGMRPHLHITMSYSVPQ
jgi:hypothetical protein